MHIHFRSNQPLLPHPFPFDPLSAGNMHIGQNIGEHLRHNLGCRTKNSKDGLEYELKRRFGIKKYTFLECWNNTIVVVVIPMLVVPIPNRLYSVYSSSVLFFLFIEPMNLTSAVLGNNK